MSLQISATINDTERAIRRALSATGTPAGANYDHREVSVSHSSETEVTIGAQVGDCGVAYIWNLDETNYVRVGFATGSYQLRIRPGRFVVLDLEPATASVFMIAAVAACKVEVYFREA